MFFNPFDLLSQSKVEIFIHKGNFFDVQCDHHIAYFKEQTFHLERTIFKAKLQIFEDEIRLEALILISQYLFPSLLGYLADDLTFSLQKMNN